MSKVAGWITHRYMKFVVIAFWLVRGRPAGPARRQADRRPGQRRRELAARRRRVHPGHRGRQRLRLREHHPGRHRLREPRRAHARGPRGDPGRRGRVRARSTPSTARSSGPSRPQDGQAAQIIVPLDLGKDGWDLAADAVDGLRATANEDLPDGTTVYVTGPAGMAADSAKAFEGIDGTLLYAAAGVVIIILLLTYRSPVLWILPLISAGVALTVAQAVIYLLADELRPHRQRAERGHPHRARVRRRDGLRPAAHSPISRRAAQAHGPARGHGRRAAPCRPGDHRLGRDRRARDARPAVRDHELDGRARPRGRHRRARRARSSR